MLKQNQCLTAVLATIGCFLVVSPVQAQYYSPNNSLFNTLQQDVASGLLSTGQAADLANRQNSLAKRAARLLRNDGGVLTPADQAKLAQEAARDNARLNQDISNNTGGTGVGGLLGNVFGTNSSYYPPANNGIFGGLFGNSNPYYGNYGYNPAAYNSLTNPYVNPTNGYFGYPNSYSGSGYNGSGYYRHRHQYGY